MFIDRILKMGRVIPLALTAVCVFYYPVERAEAGQRDNEGVVATCDAGGKTFVVKPHFGELMAVETPTGMKLGVPERWPDGQIMITANGGRMINATTCLGQHSSWFAPSETFLRSR